MASIEKRQRADGTTAWRAHYRTPAGAQRNRTFDRKVDASRFLANVETSKDTGDYVDPARAKLTVGEWAQTWLTGQTQLKPTTRERYAGVIRVHIEPRWASVPLGKVSHGDVQSWIATLSHSQSPSSVRKIYRVLSLMLDMAVRDGRLARNVAAKVNLPRPTKPEHRYLTHAQVDALAAETGHPSNPSKHAAMDSRSNENSRLVVLFLAYTGVRFGEMAALRVRRLDLARSRAAIAESVTPLQGQGLVWGTPKSHHRREVPLPDFLRNELARHVEGRDPDDLVFGGIRNHEPLRVTTFRHAFSNAADTIGVPGLHPHELRHTAASLAIAAGADVKVVQRMLGHASAAMTLDTYGHLFNDRLDEVAQALSTAREAEQLHSTRLVPPTPRRAGPRGNVAQFDPARPSPDPGYGMSF
jgi:integrase